MGLNFGKLSRTPMKIDLLYPTTYMLLIAIEHDILKEKSLLFSASLGAVLQEQQKAA
jgi:hypothetical protein